MNAIESSSEGQLRHRATSPVCQSVDECPPRLDSLGGTVAATFVRMLPPWDGVDGYRAFAVLDAVAAFGGIGLIRRTRSRIHRRYCAMTCWAFACRVINRPLVWQGGAGP